MARRDNRDWRGYNGDGDADRDYYGGGYGIDYGATGRGIAGPGEGYYGWRGWYGPGESYYGEPYGGYGYRHYEPYGWYGTGYYGEGRPNPGQYAGRGPRNYTRSDERITEDINDRLTDRGDLDAEDIDVKVNNGEVTLTGTVGSRYAKRAADDVAWGVSGVNEVHNQLRTRQNNNQGNQNQTAQQANNRQTAKAT
jgi:hypothetical protein